MAAILDRIRRLTRERQQAQAIAAARAAAVPEADRHARLAFSWNSYMAGTLDMTQARNTRTIDLLGSALERQLCAPAEEQQCQPVADVIFEQAPPSDEVVEQLHRSAQRQEHATFDRLNTHLKL